MNIIDGNLKTNKRLKSTSLTQSQGELLSVMSQDFEDISTSDPHGFLIESMFNISIDSTREDIVHNSGPLSAQYRTSTSDDLITIDIDTYE